MKCIPLILFFFLCTVAQSIGQVEKSDQSLGFGLDVTSLGGDSEQTTTNFVFNYTYYITKNISVGVGPRFGWSKSGDQKSSTIGYNGFVNFSFLTKGAFVLPYVGAQFTQITQKQQGRDDPFITNSGGGHVGIKFFLTERLNIDNNFSFTRIISGSGATEELDLNVNGSVIQLNIGLGYIIGRKN
jgi:hypothetical protein